MKHINWLAAFLVLMMMTGCGSIVYSINPAYPPRMTAAEAQDALELSLSMIKPHFNIESYSIREDELWIFRPMYGGHHTVAMLMSKNKVYYNMIERNVRKINEEYTVNMAMTSSYGTEYLNVAWKSEEEAKLFVNAAYVLSKSTGKGGQSIDTSIASARITSSVSDLKDGTRKSSPSKLTGDDTIKKEPPKKEVYSKAEGKPRKQILAQKSADKTPPVISITSHKIDGSKTIFADKSSVTIAGKVIDDSGVADVFINEQQVDINKDGLFSIDMLLKIGDNPVVVKAVDINRNEVTKQFVITRESKRKDTAIVAEKASRYKPDIGIAGKKSTPKIVITSPDLTRAVSVVAKQTTLTIIGITESEYGIMDVQINGKQADMDEKGNFSLDVPLRTGQNSIEITAIDVHNNRSTKHLVISRESGKIAQAKPEPVLAPPMTGLQSAKYYALFIAVQDYNNPDINKLDYPLNDARQLMETLISKYTFERENVVFLQNPDRRSIYKSFQDLRKRLTDKDNLLVFYAGHGMWMDDMKQGFWLPRDAAGPNDPSDWIPNSSIRDYIKAFKAKHVLLVDDACFSGGIFKVRSAFPDPKTSLEKIYEMPSRKAITSGSLKTVPDRSVFVEFLAKRLSDNNDPYLDTQKLFSSMRDAVINNSPTQQTPLYGAINEAGDEGGDFVFVRRK